MTGARFMYGAPNMRSTYRVVPLDINPPTFMRGPGATTGTFALESAMDDLAFRLGMDPIELRLRNEPDRDLSENLPFSTRRLTDCFHRGSDAFGWSRRNATPRSTRDGNQLIGIGMAATGYHTSRSQCAALARINADGTADVQCGTSDMGPGTYTSMTQVAADALGLPLNRVRFVLGDSRFPEATVAFGIEDDGECGVGRLHHREHAARPVRAHRGGRSRFAAERIASRGGLGRRRTDVPRRRPDARRELPGPAAPPWLGKP